MLRITSLRRKPIIYMYSIKDTVAQDFRALVFHLQKLAIGPLFHDLKPLPMRMKIVSRFSRFPAVVIPGNLIICHVQLQGNLILRRVPPRGFYILCHVPLRRIWFCAICHRVESDSAPYTTRGIWSLLWSDGGFLILPCKYHCGGADFTPWFYTVDHRGKCEFALVLALLLFCMLVHSNIQSHEIFNSDF